MKRLLIVLVLFVITTYACQLIAADAEVDCNTQPVGFDSNESNSQKNSRQHGKWMKWKIKAPDNTLVEFEFVAGKPNTDSTGSPFADGRTKFDFTVEDGDKVKRGTIDKGAAGNYGYQITCHLPNGKVHSVDPIIEVPRILDESKQSN